MLRLTARNAVQMIKITGFLQQESIQFPVNRFGRKYVGLFCLIAPILFGGTASGKPDISAMCDSSAQHAATATGVPVSVLRAISLTETGRKSGGQFRPWPWTVNMEGKGVWFDNEDEARAYVYKHYKRGARSFDVGCFQLNYKWHGSAFSSIEEMFDPTENSLYAARFLLDLYRELGSWPDAAGAYHSRTPKYANKYKKRFNTIFARLNTETEMPVPAPDVTQVAALPEQPKTAVIRVNRFPLLLGGTGPANKLGSLMPIDTGVGVRPLIEGG